MGRPVLILNDGFSGYGQNWDLGADWEPQSRSMRGSGVPPADRLVGWDTVAVIGGIENENKAEELAGGLRLAVEGGVTAIALFPVALKGSDRRLVEVIAPDLGGIRGLDRGEAVEPSRDAFYKYFGAYGRSISVFDELPPRVDVLGTVGGVPAAISVPIGKGALYVLPFHVAEISASYNPVMRSVLAAVEAVEAGSGEAPVPGFVDEMRLPGEQGILDRVDALSAEIGEARSEAETLRSHRQILGSASGDELERLVIEVLNLILDGTGYVAEDRPDVKAEDFWIVEAGEDRALVEVKGIGGSISRPAVNQVDNHRAENELSVEEMPGVLIVNPFRNSDAFDQRTLPVSSDVIKHAVRLNVLVLRTLDLYYLLHHALDGNKGAEKFVEALPLGGGWLQVTETDCKLHDK